MLVRFLMVFLQCTDKGGRGRKLHTFGVLKYGRNRTDVRGFSEKIGFPPVGQEEHLLLGDDGMATVPGQLCASAGQRTLSPWNERQRSIDGGTLPSRRPV